VKFLIAMVALGLLAANICFVSWKRRAMFMAACIVVPILANGARAFGTIWVAQSVGVERAVGIDHIIYGWVFFALVVAMLLGAAWPFFDRSPTEKFADIDRISGSALLEQLERYSIAPLTALASLALVTGGAHAWAGAGEALRAELPEQVALPEVKGWQRVAVPSGTLAWEPRAEGAEKRLAGHYRDAQGREVDVFLALYSSQGNGREPGGFGQGAMPPDSGWSWHSPGPKFAQGKSEVLRGDNGSLRLAVTWYASGNLITGSNMKLKLHSMADKLRLTERPAMLLIISSVGRSESGDEQSIAAFMHDAGPPRQWMDRLSLSD